MAKLLSWDQDVTTVYARFTVPKGTRASQVRVDAAVNSLLVFVLPSASTILPVPCLLSSLYAPTYVAPVGQGVAPRELLNASGDGEEYGLLSAPKLLALIEAPFS